MTDEASALSRGMDELRAFYVTSSWYYLILLAVSAAAAAAAAAAAGAGISKQKSARPI